MLIKRNENKPDFNMMPMMTMINYRTQPAIGHKDIEDTQKVLPGMKRILIVGSSGSGKSTLARGLGATLELPVIHLDRHFWHPGWVETPKEEWKTIVHHLVQRECWIIDGNYRQTLDIRLAAADTVVFLDLPRWLCTWRALKRRIQYRNRPRPDMAIGCKEPLIDPELFQFLRHIWDYPLRARPHISRELELSAMEKHIVWLTSSRQADQFLANPFDYPAYHPPVSNYPYQYVRRSA
jgi:adenylate kinase family enzyme